jgi:hypothetical protein
MDEHDALPSGRWVGFYAYRHNQARHRMELVLTITPDRITGAGGDDVGLFLISGRVHEDRRVNWVKTYPGSHDVLYSGFADHNGIWGTWEIGDYMTGGFRIWPAAWGLKESLTLEEETPAEWDANDPVPAVAGERHGI